ncbi:MAG: hypothetical protein AMXMBFR64_39730 [Myxococcales bacterium]
MTDAVAVALATQLGALRSRLVEGITAPSPEAEFARWAFECTGCPVPFNSPPIHLEPEPLRLGRAPLLAAVGYRLGAHSGRQVVQDAWRDGFQRLMGTNPFPADRISFAYRAADLLGLVLGVKALDWEEGMRWLQGVVRRRTDEERTLTWPGLLYLASAEAVGHPVTAPPITAAATEVELVLQAFGRWWSARTGEVINRDRARQLDEALLSRLALEETPEFDVPAAAVVLQAAEAAVRRRVAWYVSASETGLHESNGYLGVLVGVLRRFHVAVQQLRHRHGGRDPFHVTDEYDVQDLLHAILKFHFDDVRPEEWTPSYGGRSSRMDFLLKPERVVVEVKMTRKNLGQKEVTQELAIDKEHYRAHPDCGALVCFVYDPENRCTNPAALETDLSRADDEFKVLVVVAPVGT